MAADNVYEEVGQEVEFDWGDAPLIKPRSGGLGDHFAPGQRLQFETTNLVLSASKAGKRRIDLEALCHSEGDDAGLTLKQSFYLADKAAIQADPKKAYGASQFQNYTVACGDTPRSSSEKVNLARYVGARFDAMMRDKVIEAATKYMPDGTEKHYPATKSSEVDKFYRPTSIRPVGAEPIENDPFAETVLPNIAGAISGRRAA